MEIQIKGHIVIIDDTYLNFVLEGKWWTNTNSCGQVYFHTRVNNKAVLLHRFIMGCPKNMVVDHINGNTLDNRKQNLRICTKLQNQYNQKKHKGKSHSKYKGVTFRKELKSKPWEAFIYKDRKSKRLGYFITEKEAALAYNEAAIKCYGQFSKLNEIED